MSYQNNPGLVYEVPMQQDTFEGQSWETIPLMLASEGKCELLPPGVPASKVRLSPLEPPPGLTIEKIESHDCHTIKLENEPQVVLTNRDVSLFTHIAPFIDDDGINSFDQPKIDLECIICRSHKLEMPRHASKYSPDEAMLNVEPFTVAPCGHIFGYHCLSNWVWCSTAKGEIPRCPVCRDGLLHAGCGHLVRMNPYNIRVCRKKQLPRTIHEGGLVPDFCEDCELELFDVQLQEFERTVYPSEPAQSYRDQRADGEDRTDQLRSQMHDHLWKLFLENRVRMLRW